MGGGDPAGDAGIWNKVGSALLGLVCSLGIMLFWSQGFANDKDVEAEATARRSAIETERSLRNAAIERERDARQRAYEKMRQERENAIEKIDGRLRDIETSVTAQEEILKRIEKTIEKIPKG